MSQTDSEGFPLRPMGQDQWDKLADRLGAEQHAKTCYDATCCIPCTCGCEGPEARCTTPIPEGPVQDMTEEEQRREADGEWYLANYGTLF